MIVKDLESYVEDCGCTGKARGGLSRVFSVARGHEQLTCFVGVSVLDRTLLDRLACGTADTTLLAQAAREITEVGAFVSTMGSVRILFAPTELKVLRQLQGQIPSVTALLALHTPQPQVQTSFGTITLTDTAVILGTHVVNFPLSMSRGRRVVVIDYWRRDQAVQVTPPSAVAVSSELAVLLPLVRKTVTAEVRASTELAVQLATYSAVAAAYVVDVDDSIQKNETTAAAQSLWQVARVHAGSGSISLQGFAIDSRPTEAVVSTACKKFHESQFNAWQSSKHASSFLTLVGKGRHLDERCVGCHTTPGRAGDAGLAVTCASCHGRDDSSRPTGEQVCLTCHTSLTDPTKRFRVALDTICSPGGRVVHKKPTECSFVR